MSAMERADLQHPETWTMDQEDKNDVASRCLAGLRAQGIPATRVLLDPTKLKGGYICDTMRVKIFYDTVKNCPQRPRARARAGGCRSGRRRPSSRSRRRRRPTTTWRCACGSTSASGTSTSS